MGSIQISDIAEAKILIVDNDKLHKATLAQSLVFFKEVNFVDSGQQAIEFCQDSPPELVLIDAQLSDLDGFETCKQLRNLAHMEYCPIIFTNSFSNIQDEIKCWQAGGTGFFSQPITPLTLLMRVQAHVRLKIQNNLQKDLAIFDRSTGLRNFQFFGVYYQQQIDYSLSNKTDLAIAVLEIDCFQQYKDTYGHLAGELAIKLVARIILNQLQKPVDEAIRFSDEKFVLILPSTDINGARLVISQIIDDVNRLALPHVQSSFRVVTINAGLASIATAEEEQDIFTLANQYLQWVTNARQQPVVGAGFA